MAAQRPYIAFDGDGTLIGSFADWDLAHEWLHQRVNEPNTPLPVELHDNMTRVTRRIAADGCALIAWGEAAHLPSCDLALLR